MSKDEQKTDITQKIKKRASCEEQTRVEETLTAVTSENMDLSRSCLATDKQQSKTVIALEIIDVGADT